MLQQQRMGAGLGPLRRLSERHQHLLQVFQLRRFRLLEEGDQHHALQPVDGHLLQPRPATAAPVEQAAGFGRGSREGGQQMFIEDGKGFRVHRVGSATLRGRHLTTITPLINHHKPLWERACGGAGGGGREGRGPDFAGRLMFV